MESRRRFPREGRLIRTAQGEEKVISVDIWGDLVTLRSAEGEQRTVKLEELKQEVGPPGARWPSDDAGAAPDGDHGTKEGST